jgi:pimeloyl-ACP methyl ester carboxylesterase
MKTPILSAALILAATAVHAGTPVIDVKVSGHGRPVILIPGLATSGAVWDDTVSRLQDRFECHVVTIAGFGGAPAVKTDNLLGAVRDELLAYIRARSLDKPVLVGHSLGGAVALDVAEHAPDVPSEIVVVDTLPFVAAVMMPGVNDAAAAKNGAAAMRVRMQGQTPEQFAKYQNDVVIPSMVTKPDDIKRVAAICSKSDPATVAQAMEELLGLDLRPDLGKISSPLVVFGALADKLQYGPRAAIEQNYRNQYANAPQTRFEFFEKAKHFIMIDEPAAFAAALDKELANAYAAR